MGLLPDLLLRRRLPGRLHLDLAFAARQAGQQPVLPLPRAGTAEAGLRERIVKEQDAAGASFAVGRFDLVTERIADGTPVASIVRSGQVIELAWKNKGKRAPEVGRVPPQLALCRSCNGYIYPHEQTCPHCGADVLLYSRSLTNSTPADQFGAKRYETAKLKLISVSSCQLLPEAAASSAR